jgi:hypothetical protein
MDQRAFSRAALAVQATVFARGHEWGGDINNVSLYGLQVFGAFVPEPFVADTPADVQIHMAGVGTELTIECKCSIVRVENDAVALRIDSLSLDAFVHWRHVVALATGDADEIAHEFETFVRSPHVI